MHTLRAQLFVRIACILLVIAILGYFIPRILVRKDIDSASLYLNQMITKYFEKMDELAKSNVIDRFVRTAARLDAATQEIKIENKSNWEIASSLISQDPEIAFVQVTDSSQNRAVISPEAAHMYAPLWAQDKKERLWIKFPGKEGIFLAQPLLKEQKNNKDYLLVTQPDTDNLGLVK